MWFYQETSIHSSTEGILTESALMIDLVSITNRVFHSRGNLLKIDFTVDQNKMRVFVPDDQLFLAVKDILLNREYEYLHDFELANFRNKIVVDAGAHVGLFSLVASSFAKKVVSIEPHPFNFNLLRINKVLNNAENIVLINKALWSKQEILNLYEGSHGAAHSVIQQRDCAKKYPVQSTTLKEIIDEFGEVDLLKIDVEGSEFEILGKIGTDILKYIKCITAEIHLDMGNANHIVDFLTSCGFRVNTFSKPLLKIFADHEIRVKDLTRLKIWRKLVYSLSSLFRLKDNSLIILFARHEELAKNA
jgi:FkbM family methyltransferase